MSHYRPGDVVLAPVRFHRREESVKMRPAVVIEQQTDGRVIVCPVTSRQPDNSPHLSLGLDQFYGAKESQQHVSDNHPFHIL